MAREKKAEEQGKEAEAVTVKVLKSGHFFCLGEVKDVTAGQVVEMPAGKQTDRYIQAKYVKVVAK